MIPARDLLVSKLEPLVDIHCHLLPGLDDGAASWSEALAMAQLAVADGITTIVATPHQLGTYARNTGGAIRAAAARMQQLLDEREIALRVLPGADVRIEPDLIAKVQAGEVLTLADQHRHVLLELPHEVYLPLDRLLADLCAAGLVGILSHPERNRGVLGRPEVVRPLVERGLLLQVTAESLCGMFGPKVQGLAEWLVKQGLVHFIASDAHGTKARTPALRPAFERAAQLAGHETAVELCCRNPARVAAGEDVASGCCTQKRSFWSGRFCGRRAG